MIKTKKFFSRNDVSILESILLKGMGAYPVLSFGSKRKLPPLVFDLESSPMIDLMCSKSMHPFVFKVTSMYKILTHVYP